ncbi:FG-GAP-like repeat-containing protein [Marinoscillum furvescens]|uniref:Putative secreted protein (Por secretion system target) n=1 Tax=Marinoscillum furvescens DSM 4134 TaxID=1122208 RepID=A0A3D9L5C0_MARFU|nr:FG-GAP-like repeat-containing protein [Marinoscillum furvescens]RED98417.1 putative secreted protein (Por secretion system target) [Marinoscillum furvescens DSM 4134]
MKHLLALTFILHGITLFSQGFRPIERQAGLDQVKDINGIALADIDGDFDLDLFAVVRQDMEQSAQGMESRLYLNNNDGTFTDITEASGIYSAFDYGELPFGQYPGMKGGASWGDFNNDGLPDLLLTSVYHVQLYQNMGNLQFFDITAQSNLPETNNCWNVGATWFDYNNDGFLDLYISKWGGCASNMLYRNNQDGTFTEVTRAEGLHESQYYPANEQSNFDPSWMSYPLDANEDGLMDLMVANDFGLVNRLYINTGEAGFVDRAAEYQVAGDNDDMGIAYGDPNNDGQFDMYISDIISSAFYLNNGDGTYTDAAEALDIWETGWAWGTEFFDFDHDADEDLFVVNGFVSAAENYLYENHLDSDTLRFSNATTTWGLEREGNANGLAVFDYDNDGDQDVLISNSDDIMHFYENTLLQDSTPANKGWLQLWLEGSQSNRSAIGTRLELTTDQGVQHRYFTGADFMAQNLKPVHFGLGTATQITQLKITWPLGGVQELSGLEINQSYLLREGAAPELLDVGASKVLGCPDPKSCNYDPNATGYNNTCSYLPSHPISGNPQPANLATESYSYPEASLTDYHWTVTGGTIIEGQSTSRIRVKWGLGASGLVQLTAADQNCHSEGSHLAISLHASTSDTSHSIARLWNEVLLEAIRSDYARPTVHARNLFHASVAMYDAWALYHPEKAQPYLLGNVVGNYQSTFPSQRPAASEENLRQTMSYAVYRLLKHRFAHSPGRHETYRLMDQLMQNLGYDPNYTATNPDDGPAALGNFIAQELIQYGQTDGARESTGYDNAFYEPANAPLVPHNPGNASMSAPNRWQPLQLRTFIDQAGNPVAGNTPEFLSPEWGTVQGFALADHQAAVHTRNDGEYRVHFDPGAPPLLDTMQETVSSELFQWNFALVALWSSHLDPTDGVLWDISPRSMGNIALEDLPTAFDQYNQFYQYTAGGDVSKGYAKNPHTNLPYEEQLVPRGDYTRVLAEFWADGPDSETPPGHWFTLLNYVSDHPALVKKLQGKGPELGNLEWDVKSYFLLGGAMHDAAITAWSIKGWYDYVRPISAIRYMAARGQSTDPSLPSYDAGGIPLVPGFIELVGTDDPLAGEDRSHVGKIKLKSWKGHSAIKDTRYDQAGVGWILAENWWPYQRPSFVTPPFAGYVSGHSTFSRAAAEMLTLITGDAYFPGGMGEFVARKNEFLVFEEGPSQNVVLQWATYRDASDQCSLSRIWGGIHPPVDDIPGRLIGEKIGVQAFEHGTSYFVPTVLGATSGGQVSLYPNPASSGETLTLTNCTAAAISDLTLVDMQGKCYRLQQVQPTGAGAWSVALPRLSPGLYLLKTRHHTVKVLIQ